MELLNYLKKNYQPNTPIFVNEVKPEDMSYEAIRQELCRLLDDKKIAKFSFGIYYLPTETIMGPSVLNPYKVIQKKYISDGTNTYGFISGEDFLNNIMVSYQLSTFRTIVTNATSNQDRFVKIGTSVVLLKKSPVEVTNSNWKLLQFLQMVNDEETELMVRKKEIINKYVKSEGFLLDEALTTLCKYPDKTLKKFIESGVYNAFTKGSRQF